MSREASEKHEDSSGFQKLLARLDPDPMRAWEVYDDLRRKLVRFFEHNRCQAAEELAEEALDRVARKLNSAEIDNVAEFAFGVARTLRMENSRRTSRTSYLEDLSSDAKCPCEIASPESDIVTHIDDVKKLQCLRGCMKRLDPGDRQLIFQYYPADRSGLEERRQVLAGNLGMSLGALRIKTARLRKKLEECIKNCCAKRNRSQYSL